MEHVGVKTRPLPHPSEMGPNTLLGCKQIGDSKGQAPRDELPGGGLEPFSRQRFLMNKLGAWLKESLQHVRGTIPLFAPSQKAFRLPLEVVLLGDVTPTPMKNCIRLHPRYARSSDCKRVLEVGGRNEDAAVPGADLAPEGSQEEAEDEAGG